MNESQVETRENGKVFIRMSAYKDILTHALRFANITFNNEQVLGFCLGNKKPDSDDIDVIKAIPITHGDQVELGFSEKIHEALEQIKEEVKKENTTIVGWYHSHPNSDSFFFSDVDKKNHVYFQNEQNPLAFGIVFDHTQLKKADQAKNPNIIREKLETVEGIPGDLQEIPMPIGQADMKIDINYPDITPVIDGFKKGLQNLSSLVLNNYQSELELWSTEFNDGALIGLTKINDSLSEMNAAINRGFEKVENWIDIKFKERLDEYKEKVEGYIRKRLEGQEDLKSNTQEISELLKNEISESLDQNISDLSKSIKDNLNESINKQYELSKLDADTREKIDSSANQISNLTDQIENLSIDML